MAKPVGNRINHRRKHAAFAGLARFLSHQQERIHNVRIPGEPTFDWAEIYWERLPDDETRHYFRRHADIRRLA